MDFLRCVRDRGPAKKPLRAGRQWAPVQPAQNKRPREGRYAKGRPEAVPQKGKAQAGLTNEAWESDGRI